MEIFPVHKIYKKPWYTLWVLHNYAVLQPDIFWLGGRLSPTWWYATTHLSAGGRHNEVFPWSISPMSSRSFIFSDFYRGVCKKLWHD